MIGHLPDTKGKENVEDTDAITPIIEKEKHIVSMSYRISRVSQEAVIVDNDVTENSLLNSEAYPNSARRTSSAF